MKTRIARYFLIATGLAGLAGTPALFAGDMHRDYHNLGRENTDIRSDRWRVHEDLERGRYRRADRERADLNRDYRERDRQVRDIRRDERYRYGYGWR